MKLREIRIRRLRAFDKDVTIPLSDLTVLTGPNNLGKSTILRALSIFFGNIGPPDPVRTMRGDYYNPDEDYPKFHAGKPGRRWQPFIQVGFDLQPDEILEARKCLGFDLPAQFAVKQEYRLTSPRRYSRPDVKVDFLVEHEKVRKFLDWLSDNCDYVYVPTTRNVEDLSRSVYRELAAVAISALSHSRRRVLAIQQFQGGLGNELRAFEGPLATEVKKLLPETQTVSFVMRQLNLADLVSIQDVMVNDGIASTSIGLKGDGFKSLFTMSIMQFLARRGNRRHLIFGIEEPEAHLHPSAVYAVKSNLRELSKNFQIVITTHSPILVERDHVSHNIIVNRGESGLLASTAKPAKTLADVRGSLGAHLQDNMVSSEVLLFVEGPTDANALQPLLCRAVPELGRAFGEGRVSIRPTRGASNILGMVRAYGKEIANCVVLVDSDAEGLRAESELASSGFISPADIFRVPARPGCRETEFEDAFDPSMYVGMISSECGISVTAPQIEEARIKSGDGQTRMKKWSEVMAALLNEHGHKWESVCGNIKAAFARGVAETASTLDMSKYPWICGIAKRVAHCLKQG